jgi:hypothetical protein
MKVLAKCDPLLFLTISYSSSRARWSCAFTVPKWSIQFDGNLFIGGVMKITESYQLLIFGGKLVDNKPA